MTSGPKTFKMHIWCICVTLWHFRSFKCPPRVLCSPQTVFTFLFCPFNINIPTQLIVSSACFMMPSLSWMCRPSFVDSLVHHVSILNYLWLSFTKAGITTGQVVVNVAMKGLAGGLIETEYNARRFFTQIWHQSWVSEFVRFRHWHFKWHNW